MSGIEFEGEEFVDWRGRKVTPEKHGGARAASFACVVEVLENVVFLANASNFVQYFIKSMHYPVADASNMVTNFMGTSFLLTIVGGFISDSFLTRFTTFIISCTVELLGLMLLTIQAHRKSLQPAMNETPSNSQAAVLYTGLYAMAIGVGGIKASLPAHGADQLDHTNQRRISAFFNWFFFSLCAGGFISSTVMVWIEENKGWRWSFVISIIVLSVAFFIFAIGFPIYKYKRPAGSPITRIFKVFASAIRNRKASSVDHQNGNSVKKISNKYRFLNKALVDDTTSLADVEETKTFIGLLPIFASTILMNCCLAQLQTFSVQQGSIMNKKIKNFEIPTQSLTVIPLTVMLSSIPAYEFLNSYINKNSKIHKPLARIGLGLALASASMGVAAAVEVKRREAAENGYLISVFWLSWQYLLLGVSDMLTLGGMLEFFYSEAPSRMRSLCTALAWCSTSMGYFFSSVLVSIANSASGHKWLGGKDLNNDRLELFYTLLCVLNFLNFFNYVFWAKRY
ncbi:hypothetical protein HS088_TW06G00422 [Tripterygium wilfordii]|uniref:Uncharacterized protein n=1 Tax=Tripterygium wilfordii TaxID=458696 RepID=A0A7J7DIR7_TRIWF|nr:protein NRT1/ PTR FAMILY 4.2 [Tripterygium wilfordii]XP_038703197.1 protein NRT1/ PTR FAMILY 4.2 [Tripterygium wilfordii]KAF5746252.1 hypothetical protein HS088_TW06G00422 [Tripterygium wilfordii]